MNEFPCAYFPHVVTAHCVLHRIHLVAKKLSGELHEALMICIRSINKIKAHPLNSRVFAKLCEKNVETANQLLMHTEVRWLSRGDSLQRLHSGVSGRSCSIAVL
jgi:hypothetical protein